MKILDLTNKDKSEIKYEVSSFPDGQQQIKILSNCVEQEEIAGTKIFYSTGGHEVQCRTVPRNITIKSRLNDWLDLERIVCATQSLRNKGVGEIHLYTPYFLGSRSDRSFNEDENNYLKHVICPIINLQGYKSVTVLDPHSDVLEACLNGFNKVDQSEIVHDILGTKWADEVLTYGEFILVAPDAGAAKKIYKVADRIKYKGEIITCSKVRNNRGELILTNVPLSTECDHKDIIIIDDICDGGKTFIEIAREIDRKYQRQNDRKGKKYLIVTHGIFSKGFKELSKYFDGIYCTNSYGPIPTQDNKELEYASIVKQLDIFI